MAFRYDRGQWWWADGAKQRYNPTLGPRGKLPALRYMDVGAIFVPAEAEQR